MSTEDFRIPKGRLSAGDFDNDALKIIRLLLERINTNLVVKQIKIRLLSDAAKYILEKMLVDRSFGARPLRSGAAEVHRGPALGSAHPGSLPRPAELEVYLGDAAIYCRPVSKEGEGEEVTVGAGTETAPGTPLYMF